MSLYISTSRLLSVLIRMRMNCSNFIKSASLHRSISRVVSSRYFVWPIIFFLWTSWQTSWNMAATHRQEEDMKRKCKEAMANAKDPIEKLRLSCLSRGASGIKGIGRWDDVCRRSLADCTQRAKSQFELCSGAMVTNPFNSWMMSLMIQWVVIPYIVGMGSLFITV